MAAEMGPTYHPQPPTHLPTHSTTREEDPVKFWTPFTLSANNLCQDHHDELALKDKHVTLPPTIVEAVQDPLVEENGLPPRVELPSSRECMSRPKLPPNDEPRPRMVGPCGPCTPLVRHPAGDLVDCQWGMYFSESAIILVPNWTLHGGHSTRLGDTHLQPWGHSTHLQPKGLWEPANAAENSLPCPVSGRRAEEARAAAGARLTFAVLELRLDPQRSLSLFLAHSRDLSEFALSALTRSHVPRPLPGLGTQTGLWGPSCEL